MWAPGTDPGDRLLMNARRSAWVKYRCRWFLRYSLTIAVLTAQAAIVVWLDKSSATLAVVWIIGVMRGLTLASRSLIHPLLHGAHAIRTF